MVAVFVPLAAPLVAAYILPDARPVAQLMLGNAQLGSMFWIWLVVITFSQAAFNGALALPWVLGIVAIIGGIAAIITAFRQRQEPGAQPQAQPEQPRRAA